MLFNSSIFIIFLVIFFVFWVPIKKTRNLKWAYLTITSFIFYAWWDWRFLFLIIFSGLVDYIAGIMMYKYKNTKRFWLILSLAINIGSLSIFKYSLFFATTIENIFNSFSIPLNLVNNIPSFALILPVGISFYTFQSMSYTIDIYRNRLSPTNNIFHFFAFLSMFPQLVAGPIIRAKDLLKQLNIYRKVSLIEFWHGLKLITVGFFQKIVLADNIGELVNICYSDSNSYSGGILWWLVTIGFALQIYFDFSGYSLIARGIAKWMGYHFKINFNHPYLASSLKQFWQRWHISLSTWFRDYVYIPLGGSKKGKVWSHVFMWTTMILSGFWHGASITFIIWGVLHSLFLSLERITKTFFRLPKFLNYIFTISLVLFAWIFFRAENISQAKNIISYLFNFSNPNIYWDRFENAYYFLFIAILIEVIFFIIINNKTIRRIYQTNLIQGIEIALLITACLFYRGIEQEFIYFQF